MFKAGKKYAFGSSHKASKCIAVHNNCGWMENESGLFTTPWHSSYKEVKEPATRTWWINIYKNTRTGNLILGGMHDDEASARRAMSHMTGESQKFLDTVEFTYTEKQDA